MTTAGAKTLCVLQQVRQSHWRSVGFAFRIHHVPARGFVGQSVRHRRFEGMAMFAWSSSPENIPRTTLHSTMIPSAGNGWSGQNYTGFRNAEMDRLLDQVEVICEEDEKDRKSTRLNSSH